MVFVPYLLIRQVWKRRPDYCDERASRSLSDAVKLRRRGNFECVQDMQEIECSECAQSEELDAAVEPVTLSNGDAKASWPWRLKWADAQGSTRLYSDPVTAAQQLHFAGTSIPLPYYSHVLHPLPIRKAFAGCLAVAMLSSWCTRPCTESSTPTWHFSTAVLPVRNQLSMHGADLITNITSI